jgi:hypothetical protein
MNPKWYPSNPVIASIIPHFLASTSELWVVTYMDFEYYIKTIRACPFYVQWFQFHGIIQQLQRYEAVKSLS